ncbi:major facilitator superfamily domain-containing protein 6 [Nephila pilipes]|uniref:Major facilitator superfamily domain-containing protein 6 n=1 Tax=Nephila pilipes TaxID=299642 RepID=A0A8X6MYI5_NEPPI|nr:major facilitator superfamily domain-containing protein 6 [Nephila pilipes]
MRTQVFFKRIMVTEKNGKSGDIYTISTGSSSEKKAEVKKGFWNIDKDTFRFKVHYFLFMAALSVVLPFLSVLSVNRIGLSATALAAVLISEQFLCILSKPLLGYIADYFNKLKVIIGVLVIIQVVFLFLMLTVPKIQREGDAVKFSKNTSLEFLLGDLNVANFTVMCQQSSMNTNNSSFSVSSFNNKCSEYITDETFIKEKYSNESYLIFFSNASTFSASQKNLSVSVPCGICCKTTGEIHAISCQILKSVSMESSSELKQGNDFKTSSFWLFTLYLIISMVATNAFFTLSDTACCESVAKTGADFGRQRLWGAISWGVICPLGGLLNDYTDDYLVSWILMAVLFAVTLWNIKGMDMVKPSFSQNILKDVGVVLRSKEFLSFLFGVLINGISTGFVWYYLMLFLIQIGGNRFLLGMTQSVQCFVGEIPCMFFSGWLIKKFGHFNILTLSLLSYCIRFLWYSYLKNPWLVLPVELFHGITYGAYYPVVASYAKLSAKPGTEATTQAVLFTTHEGLGAGLGCVLAGIGFDRMGGHKTFFLAGIFSACGVVINFVCYLWIWRQKGSINVTPAVDA